MIILSRCSAMCIQYWERYRFLPYSICDETPEVRDVAFSIQPTTTTVHISMYSVYTNTQYIGRYLIVIYYLYYFVRHAQTSTYLLCVWNHFEICMNTYTLYIVNIKMFFPVYFIARLYVFLSIRFIYTLFDAVSGFHDCVIFIFNI